MIFPYLNFFRKNKVVKNRIDRIGEWIEGKKSDLPELEYVHNPTAYSETDLQPFFDKTLETKKNLEEKGKAIFFTIAASSAFIIGFLSMMVNNTKMDHEKGWCFLTAAVFAVFSIA